MDDFSFHELIQELKSDLLQGQLNKVAEKLKQISQTPDLPTELKREAESITARINICHNKQSHGILSTDQVSVEQNRLVLAAVELIDSITYYLENREIKTIGASSLAPDIPVSTATKNQAVNKNFNTFFAERSNKEKRESIVTRLKKYIQIENAYSDWSSKDFTPLEAEIEVEVKNSYDGKIRKVIDLVSAIKKSKDSLIIVLGDPGSGKSVALRKLAEELLAESLDKNFLPIYLNLKQWQFAKDIQEVSKSDVKIFVYEQLDKILGGNPYFMSNLESLFHDRRFYFILDSFDEIPAILDEEENSPGINNLTKAVGEFLLDYGHRSIIASRYFKKPRGPIISIEKTTILEIRPFTEKKISNTLKKAGIGKKTRDKLFRNRGDLTSIAKNPLSCMLLAKYLKSNNHKFPKNQADLYEDYIERLLKGEKPSHGIKASNEEILSFCQIIAKIIFQGNKEGFEVSLEQLSGTLEKEYIARISKFLKDIKLLRIGKSKDASISFIHRRFAEYFAVRLMINGELSVILQDIENDGRTRDTLVLYASIVELDRAKEIVNHCWEIICEEGELSDMAIINFRAIHCLRFLVEAFRFRLDSLTEIRNDLSEFISRNINKNAEFLALKYALEALGLLPEEKIKGSLLDIIDINNSLINDTALQACRYLSTQDEEIGYHLRKYFSSLNIFDFLKKYGSIKFSLRLSDAFKGTSTLLDLYYSWIISNFILLLVYLYFFPLISTISISLVAINWIIFKIMKGKKGLRDISSRVLAHINLTITIFIPLSILFLVLLIEPGFDQENESLIVINYIFNNLESINSLGSISPLIYILIPIIVFYFDICHGIIIVFEKISSPKGRKLIKNHLVDGLIRIGLGLIFYALLGGIIYFFKSYGPESEEFLEISTGVPILKKIFLIFRNIIGIFIALAGAYMYFEFIKSLILPVFRFSYDLYKNLSRFITSREFEVPSSRSDIFNTLKNLKSDEERMEYLIDLESKISKMKGKYPGNDFLKVSSSPVNTKLAQLEEKWQKAEYYGN